MVVCGLCPSFQMMGQQKSNDILHSFGNEPERAFKGAEAKIKMKHYLLFYEAGEDYVSKRASLRAEHLEKAWQASAQGDLVLAGALADPVDGAVLLFKGDSPEIAERFAQSDPYVRCGAVKRWYVREWTTVAGEGAAAPVRPDAVSNSKNPPNTSSNGVKPPSSRAQDMVLRMWRGHTSFERAGEYVQHATGTFFPKLEQIPGNCGAYLLQRTIDGKIEFVVLTLWNSMEAILRFAGEEPDRAVVEPEARSLLSGFDDFVMHFDVVRGIERTTD
jgi:uncharacterized protein YciI/heme-degrading monooxygenase HmoA